MSPRVSICMPASRGHAQFRAALRSALEQDFDDLEVVVSDDSGDLAAVVEEFDDSRIRYFRNPDRLGYAKNSAAAFDRAQGALLGWLHDDDRLLPRFLRELVPLFDDDPELGVAFTSCRFENSAGRSWVSNWPVEPGRHTRFVPDLLRHRPIYPSAALVRAETWREARDPWPEDLDTADVILWARAAATGHTFFYLDAPLAVYGVHTEQFTADEQRFREHSIRLFELLKFDDPDYERVRREQLAYELLLRATLALRQGHVTEARTDLDRARDLDSESFRARRKVTAWLARHPRVAPPIIHSWRRTRALRERVGWAR